MASRFLLASALAVIGDFSRATALIEEGARLSMARDTALNRLRILIGSSVVAIVRGEFKIAMPSLEKGLALVHELNLLVWLPAFAGFLGHTYACMGRVTEGLRLLEEAATQAETRNRSARAGLAHLQSHALLLAGQASEARSAAEGGLQGARGRGERSSEAFCLLALGASEAYSDIPAAVASAHLQEALALATELGMRPLVAHCHFGLGKLYGRTGKRQEKQEQLATSAAMYREMDMTYRLEQAERELELPA